MNGVTQEHIFLSYGFGDPDVSRAVLLLEALGDSRLPGLFRLLEAPAFHRQSQWRS